MHEHTEPTLSKEDDEGGREEPKYHSYRFAQLS